VLDSKGVVIDTGNAAVSNLAPGQTARQELTITATQDQHPAKLRVTQVQRTASA
jgi:hypothetical protein